MSSACGLLLDFAHRLYLLGIVAAAIERLGFMTGMKGVAFYLFVYGFMTIGAFAVLIVLQRQGIIGDELDDLNGLYRRSPMPRCVLLIFMLRSREFRRWPASSESISSSRR